MIRSNTGSGRPLCLRGPLVVCGWGISNQEGSVPNNIVSGTYLTHTETWGAGPVDWLWDDRRKVWTGHDVVWGFSTTVFGNEAGNPNGSLNIDGTLGPNNIWYGGWNLLAYNYFDTPIQDNVPIFAFFDFINRDWVVFQNCCPMAQVSGGRIL